MRSKLVDRVIKLMHHEYFFSFRVWDGQLRQCGRRALLRWFLVMTSGMKLLPMKPRNLHKKEKVRVITDRKYIIPLRTKDIYKRWKAIFIPR
jgi:hypothetical protein